MKVVKKYGKTIAFFLLVLFLLSLIITLFNWTSLLYQKQTDTVLFIGTLLTMFVIGFSYGKKALRKGYLEGLKIGLCLIFLFIMINFIFYQTGFSLERILYYMVLVLSSILGSMLGINKKN